jgi:hypothetical protein
VFYRSFSIEAQFRSLHYFPALRRWQRNNAPILALLFPHALLGIDTVVKLSSINNATVWLLILF